MMRYRTLQELGRTAYTFRGHGVRLVNYEPVAQTFFRLLYVHHITKPYMRSLFEWLHFLGRYIFLNYPLTIRFFQVTNDQLSARFLAKFLAFGFRKGFSVNAVLKPIRRDLRLSQRLASRMHYKIAEKNRMQQLQKAPKKFTAFLPFFSFFRK